MGGPRKDHGGPGLHLYIGLLLRTLLRFPTQASLPVPDSLPDHSATAKVRRPGVWDTHHHEEEASAEQAAGLPAGPGQDIC